VAIAPVDGVPYLSERFAADLIRIDANGNAADSEDLTRNDSFIGYGAPVYAVADGRVVSTVDDVAENTPLHEPPGSQFTLRTIVGNRVVLELADGTYATYGHLKTGSVAVRIGQRVHRGQRLARVGNTGVSGAPHLHFQLSDGPDPVASDGRPYALRSFRHTGMATNVEQFLMGAAPANVLPSAAPDRHDQMPLHASVLDFG
jgi:murein DD-endopeptidase MepM/ murein hydrolase activator NlpD